MKLTIWDGGRFMLEGQTTKTFCFVESDGHQFRARIRAIEGWDENMDFEAYEGCGGTQEEAIANLAASLPPEPPPPAPPNRKPCVLCGADVGYWPQSGRNKLSMRLTHGLPDVYIICDSCLSASDDSEALAFVVMARTEQDRRESLA